MNKQKMRHSDFKLKHPCRNQVSVQISALDDLIPLDHRARIIWAFVTKMDTSPCLWEINSFYGEVGRPATSPTILLALWLYSILDGNSSARKLEELCQHHTVYRWLAGGVSVNRTTLAEFRSKHPSKFEDLLTNCLAVMLQEGVIELEGFSQDGTKIKANAGFGSYRRKESLNKLKEEVRQHIKKLDKETTSSGVYEKRKKAVLADREKRIEKALEVLENEKKNKIANRKKTGQPPSDDELENTRASTTDPEARKMKMGDGGFRIAYNVQFATGVNSRVIYGVDVVNTLDPGTSPRLASKVHVRLNKLGLPAAKSWIADSAYSSKEDINVMCQLFPGCIYYAPPKLKKGCDPKRYQRNDTDAVRRWRDSIDTPVINELYRFRCSTSEFSNAQIKNKGLSKFSMRTLIKAKGESLLNAIAHNICRFMDLFSRVSPKVREC